MKKVTVRIAAVAASILAAGAIVTPGQAEELRIGTASLGGAFYPVGQSISNMVTKYAGDGMTMVPIVTAGSVQNPRLVNTGEVDMGITNNNLALFANEGMGPYKSGKMDLRAAGALHFSVLHMVTLDGSPIKTFADIKGKRIAVGPAGGGTLSFLRRLLSLYGMTMRDIRPNFLSYADGFSQLADGNVDAAFALSGYPSSAVSQARASKKLRFITISDAKMKEALAKYKFYSRVEIPKEVYRLDRNAVVLGVNNMLVVKASMDADKVYRITKAIYDHMKEFRENNALAKQIDPKRSLSLTIPLHPGAERYFKSMK